MFAHIQLEPEVLKKNHRESLSFLAFQSHEQWDEDAINKEGKKTRDAFALEQATIKTGIEGIMFAFILTMKYFVSETETKSYVLKNEMSFSFTPPSYFLKPQTSCHVKIWLNQNKIVSIHFPQWVTSFLKKPFYFCN